MSPKKQTSILLPYQQRWLSDKSRFKIALKARQIGFSFIIALEGLIEAIEYPRNVIFVSASERQSLELLEKVYQHTRAMEIITDKLTEEEKKKECRLKNGGRIISLPANPQTIRGFTGSVYLDEFAFHRDAIAILRAAVPMVARGNYNLRIISTPAGDQGAYYDLWTKENDFSKHSVDIYQAVEEGLEIDIDELKHIYPDPDSFAQEFECKFLSDRESYFSLPLINSCVSAECDRIAGEEAQGDVYIGIDVGRKRDRTVIYTLQKIGDVFYSRPMEILDKTQFQAQYDFISGLIETIKPRRVCIDSTGLGMQLAEDLAHAHHCVEGVSFTAPVKEKITVDTRILLENRNIRIPDDRDLIRDIHAIKKIVTIAGNIRYDAARNESGHADRYWALALAVHAGSSSGPAAACGSLDPEENAWRKERKSIRDIFPGRRARQAGPGADKDIQ